MSYVVHITESKILESISAIIEVRLWAFGNLRKLETYYKYPFKNAIIADQNGKAGNPCLSILPQNSVARQLFTQ